MSDTLPPGAIAGILAAGWAGGPLCGFLGVPVPECPFPRVNRRDELTPLLDEEDDLLTDPDVGMRVAREYIDRLKDRAFAS